MTGMTLEALATTWVGKLTNLSASYWNHELITLLSDGNEYLWTGTVCFGCWVNWVIASAATYRGCIRWIAV